LHLRKNRRKTPAVSTAPREEPADSLVVSGRACATFALLAKFVVFAFSIWCCSAALQSTDQPVDIDKEPHHTLVLEKTPIRVFRLLLQPNEATLLHKHLHPYAFVSLKDTTISNEVPERPPVLRDLAAGELHTSKGGFVLAERNASNAGAELLIIERTADPGPAFDSPMVNFQYHDAAIAELFEGSSMRAYGIRMAPGGRTEPHEQRFDRLLIAVTDLHLTDQLDEQKQSPFNLKTGDVQWIPKEVDRAVLNAGNAPCSFLTIEFN
jgi:quercetin dioxygenase-like cupin family protein